MIFKKIFRLRSLTANNLVFCIYQMFASTNMLCLILCFEYHLNHIEISIVPIFGLTPKNLNSIH